MDKQNIVLTSIKMHERKKSKTEKSPTSSIKFYKSTLSKQPYLVKNKHSIVRDSCHPSTKETKINYSGLSSQPADPIRTIESKKSHRFAEGSLGSSNLKYYESDVNENKITRQTFNQPRTRQSQPKIEDLLGICSNDLSKKASIIASFNQHQSSICNESYEEEIEKLRAQNKQLMRVNQMLLYEKEYFKQKNILQEVEIRQLTRKLNQFDDAIISKKWHQKNKSQSQESDLTFKFKTEKDKENKNQTMNELRQTKPHRIINLANHHYTQKSSLLVSESEQDRIPFKNRENIGFGQAQSTSHVKKTQKQFADLLQCVQNQSNLNRKTTLRKMLAIKAMELKKVKQKY